MKYPILLFDADDTLFDFFRTAEKCFTETSEIFGLPSSRENYELYLKINQKYWDMYSEGKIKKEEIITGRFKEYGEEIGITFDIPSFARIYSKKLSETSVLFPETVNALTDLKRLGAEMYLITNGISEVQRGRLKLSGLENFFKGVFISDEIGAAKPTREFFDAVSKRIKDFDKKKTLIIGDSPLSDITLGYENGVDTCLVKKRPKKSVSVPHTYEINDLNELIEIVK